MTQGYARGGLAWTGDGAPAGARGPTSSTHSPQPPSATRAPPPKHSQRIDQEVGPRELTVRQMLLATALRSRQPSLSGPIGVGGPEILPTIASAGNLRGDASDGGDGGHVGDGGSGGGRVVIDVRRATKDGAASPELPAGTEAAGGGAPPAARVPSSLVLEDIQRIQAVTALAQSLSGRSPTSTSSPGSPPGGGGAAAVGGGTAGGGGEAGGALPRAGFGNEAPTGAKDGAQA
jgi:hypothetical protein